MSIVGQFTLAAFLMAGAALAEKVVAQISFALSACGAC